MIIRSAKPPSTTKHFLPFIKNFSPFFSAVTSEIFGLCLGPSSNAKQQVRLPFAISGRYFFFCSLRNYTIFTWIFVIIVRCT